MKWFHRCKPHWLTCGSGRMISQIRVPHFSNIFGVCQITVVNSRPVCSKSSAILIASCPWSRMKRKLMKRFGPGLWRSTRNLRVYSTIFRTENHESLLEQCQRINTLIKSLKSLKPSLRDEMSEWRKNNLFLTARSLRASPPAVLTFGLFSNIEFHSTVSADICWRWRRS